MLVSNFYASREVKKPLMQQGPWDGPIEYTGYELRVTNCSDEEIRFEVVWRTSNIHLDGSPSPGGVRGNLNSFFPSYHLLTSVGWLDRGLWRKDLFLGNYYSLVGETVKPHGSALFSLGPNADPGKPLNYSIWPLWVAGYVELYAPYVRSPENPHDVIAQSGGPVPVLLDATRRTWQIDRRYEASHDLSESSVPLATGKAYNEVEPEQPYSVGDAIGLGKYLGNLKTMGASGLSAGAMGLPTEDRAQTLIDLLAMMGDDPDEAAALNHVLEDLGKPVRVSTSNHALLQ